MNGETIRTITIRGQSEGLDKLTADINKLVTAEQNLAVVSEETGRRTLSLEAAWKRQTMRLDEAARAQANIARETKLADMALREGLATQAQHAQRLEQINQRYGTATTATQNYGKAVQQGTGEVRLARHELINLSRQLQDVGVGLASGQSPFTILVQQGTQIADVFATSTGTLRGFFAQATAGAARFLTSWLAIGAGATAIVGGVALAAASFISAQREIEKALLGMGAAAGVTRDQINQIGFASSSAFGLSIAQATEAATAFAATGNVYKENLGQATRTLDAFVQAGGDAEKITKALGEALANPAAGALEMNKSLKFLNVTTLEYIRSLQEQGKLSEAQAALMAAMAPALAEQTKLVSGMGKAWAGTSNAISNAMTLTGQGSLMAFEMMTGIEAGGFSLEQQLERATAKLKGIESASGSALPYSTLRMAELRAEVERLEQAVAKSGAAAKDLAQLGIQAEVAALKFVPMRLEIEKIQVELIKLRAYQAQGGTVDPGIIAIGEVRVRQLKEQEETIKRQAQYTQQIAAMYPDMSIEGAKQAHQAQLQLAITQARTPEERNIAEAIAQQHQMLLAGMAPAEALKINALQRGVAEIDILNTMELQNAKATQRAISGQVIETSTTETADQSERQLTSSGETFRVVDQTAQTMGTVANNTANAAGSMASFASSAARGAVGVGDIASAMENVLDQLPTQFPDSYEFFHDPMYLEMRKNLLEKQYGAGNVEIVQQPGGGGIARVKPEFQQSQFEKEFAAMGDIGKMDVSSPAAIQKVMTTILGKGFAGGLGDVNRLLGIVSDPQQQAGLIQQAIAAVMAKEQPSLARTEMINELNSKLEALANSTDALNSTMQNALSPLYSQDPRTTKLGFREGAYGDPSWLTAPGMANGGSFVVGGGSSANDNRMAMFPVASGEQVIVNRNRQQAAAQVVNIDNRIVVAGVVDADTLSRMKVSRYQQSQRLRAGMARA